MSGADSQIQITDAAAATKYQHTWARSYGGTTKEDAYMLRAYATRATYRAYASAVSTATSASHLLFIQADGTNYSFINGIWISQTTLAGGAATANIQVIRTSTAGSGGGAISAYPADAGDTSPYAGTIQTLPSSKGTEGVTLFGGPLGIVAAQPMNVQNQLFYRMDADEKEIIIGTANTDGICIKIVTAIATSKVDLLVEFTTAADK